MADNTIPSVDERVATDQVTHSGDTAHVQLLRPVLVSGTEGAKTVVDLTGDATNGLDVDVTRLPPLVAGTAYIGKVRFTDGTNDITFSTGFADAESNTQTVVPVEGYSMLFNGTTWDRMRGDITNGLDVDVTRVKPDGTNTMPSLDAAARRGYFQITDGTTNAAVSTSGGLEVSGDVAHDSPDAGLPVKVGAKAESSPAGLTLVADGDRTEMYADIDGVQMVKPFTAYGDILVERLSDTGGNSTASTVFGATASARNFITTIAVYNDSTTGGFIDFRDGTAGTILFTLPLPAKGGAVCNFTLPLRQTTANTAFAYDVSAALTTVYISLIGFKSKA